MTGAAVAGLPSGAPYWLLAGLLSALATVASIAYARRRGLLDQPGRRRSHRLPTPRGGGVGIVLGVLCVGLLPLASTGSTVAWIAASLLMVAAVGWIDDHGPLSARLRLAVHILAAWLLVWAIMGRPASIGGWAWCALLLTAVVWSINLHNFIDGIDGLLSLQAVAIFGTVAWFAQRADAQALTQIAAVSALATLAFVPFNLPRARIFLGDVGSGALGLLIAVVALLALRDGVLDLGALLMLCSASGVDATATLLSRIWRGRRWSRPHREHLYQWLVRSGSSHARVAIAYLAWTALLVPALLSARAAVHASPWAIAHPGPAECLYFAGWPAATLGVAVGIWLTGKRACRRRAGTHSRRCVPPN